MNAAAIVDTLLEDTPERARDLAKMRKLLKVGTRWKRINHNWPTRYMNMQGQPTALGAGVEVEAEVFAVKRDGVEFMLYGLPDQPGGVWSWLGWPDGECVWISFTLSGGIALLRPRDGRPLLSYQPCR